MRRNSVLATSTLVLAATVGLLAPHVLGQNPPTTVVPADYLKWRTTLRNWGRWGPNDQKGAANLITPAKVQAAAALVKSGIVVSMAHPVPQAVAADVGEAQVFRRTTNNITATGTTDTYQVSYHGLATSQRNATSRLPATTSTSTGIPGLAGDPSRAFPICPSTRG